jgi:hypothetical protein
MAKRTKSFSLASAFQNNPTALRPVAEASRLFVGGQLPHSFS